jgi:integrase
MTNLKKEDISTDTNGKRWIIKRRQKTGIVSTIPLLPKAIEIIEKYSNGNADLLPHYSIQKFNQYIGEVGNIAGINKKLSSHVGRRTFGNIALGKGISINVISKILGHSNTLITQRIYAITTQKIIDKEIEKW